MRRLKRQLEADKEAGAGAGFLVTGCCPPSPLGLPGGKEALATPSADVLLLTSRQLAALPLAGGAAAGDCASLVVRYSQAPTSQALVDARAAAAAGLGPLVALSRRPAQQRLELARVHEVERRLKAAAQMVACGGHCFYHAMLQLGGSESYSAVRPYAATALQLYCLHAYGEVPRYAVREPAAAPRAAKNAGRAAEKEQGGGAARAWSCSVHLPGPVGPDEAMPLVLQSGDCGSEEEARGLAAFAACRCLFDEVRGVCGMGERVLILS